jgi:hypothetical protein
MLGWRPGRAVFSLARLARSGSGECHGVDYPFIQFRDDGRQNPLRAISN